jgi:hypothetical protein
MILRPCVAHPAPPPHTVPAWDAILSTQREHADRYLLITQDDHARLAGGLAAAFQSSWLPEIDDEIVDAIAMHDCGWRALDEELLANARAGERPVSFLDMSVPQFLAAWTESIGCVAERSPLGGAVVSVHFSRLAEYRLKLRQDPLAGTDALTKFLQTETDRRSHLVAPCGASPIPFLVDVLQLCDLVSLYLCCGTMASVQFPQFDGKLKLRRDGDRFIFDPSPTSRSLLSVEAMPWPAEANVAPDHLRFQFESE